VQTITRHNSSINDSELQINHIENVFKRYDIDHSGRLDKGELIALLRDLGFEHGDREVETIMREADLNNDSQLSFSEFYRSFSGSNLPSWYNGQYANKNVASTVISKSELAQPPKIAMP
jgi:Ca2+-binding EF-hand superfamily protein